MEAARNKPGELYQMKRVAFWSIYVVFTIFFVSTSLEIMVRVLGLAPPVSTQYGNFVPDGAAVYRLKPNIVRTIVTPEFTETYAHNSRGFRDEEHQVEKRDNAFRIVALGDSFTYGVGAEYEETYLFRLERLLNESSSSVRPIEIIKMGVPMYYPELERRMFEYEGIAYRPDLVFVALAPNDIIDTYNGIDSVYVNADGYLQSRETKKLGPAATALYRKSHLARIALRAYVTILQSFRKKIVWSHVYRPNGIYEQEWERVEAELKRVAERARRIGSSVVFVHIPMKPPWDSPIFHYTSYRLSRIARKVSAETVDTLPFLENQANDSVLYYPNDGHATPAGYAIIARAIFDTIRAKALVPGAEGRRSSYVVKVPDSYDLKSLLKSAETGDGEAQLLVANIFVKRGEEADDRVQALVWAGLAATFHRRLEGRLMAEQLRDRLMQNMTEDERKRSLAAIDEWWLAKWEEHVQRHRTWVKRMAHTLFGI